MTTDKREELSMDTVSGRVPGSREPSPDGLGPSGFDPARIADFIRGWCACAGLVIVLLFISEVAK